MTKKYADYLWRKGLPIGQKVLEQGHDLVTTFKIVMDPYRRRISIEKYRIGDQFDGIIYDSALINFRKLSMESQSRWQRIIEAETDESMQTLIRDDDDRVIFREYTHYENSHCRYCRIESPHGLVLAHQRIFYTVLKDPFNGVILYDAINKPVLRKKYVYDEGRQEFGELVSEEWEVDPELLNIETDYRFGS